MHKENETHKGHACVYMHDHIFGNYHVLDSHQRIYVIFFTALSILLHKIHCVDIFSRK